MLPPVVYVGPTIDRAAAKRWFPRARFRPPVQRGDLYRDRELGFGVFLILDGVFFERLAISPREIVDVLRDGGVVFGASSMGAIRAADCWPAGMHGIGAIARLYRRGCLSSEDEVAVGFAPVPPYRAVSVPLVNVRYAVAKAVRNRLITPSDGGRIVDVATARYFTERDWRSILAETDLADPDDRLVRFMTARDLKRVDAIRALKVLRAWCERNTDAGNLPTQSSLRQPASPPREPAICAHVLQADASRVWSWLLASGRYRRYASALQWECQTSQAPLADPGWRGAARWEEIESDTAAAVDASGGSAPGIPVDARAIAVALASGRSSPGLLAMLATGEAAYVARLWAEIAASGDVQAVLLRFVATARAAQHGRMVGLRPEAPDRHVARVEIANNHGFRSWSDLQAAFERHLRAWATIEQAADELSLAKRLRRHLFTAPRAADRSVESKGTL